MLKLLINFIISSLIFCTLFSFVTQGGQEKYPPIKHRKWQYRNISRGIKRLKDLFDILKIIGPYLIISVLYWGKDWPEPDDY